MDFTWKDDGGIFPIVTREGGAQFGFCPGKATWYPDVKNFFDLLVLAAETGQPLFAGGLAEQPDWAVEALGWFVPDYREMQSIKRNRALFGSKESKSATTTTGTSNAVHSR